MKIKKNNWMAIASALGGAAGHTINAKMKKKGIPPFVAVSLGTVAAAIAVDNLLPDEEPLTHAQYLDSVAQRNTK